MSRARVYCDVNETRPREYWDYENLNVTWGYVAFISICGVQCGPILMRAVVVVGGGGGMLIKMTVTKTITK